MWWHKKDKAEKKDELVRIILSYRFFVTIHQDGETYYLNSDGNFYTTMVNTPIWAFETEEKRDQYIDDHLVEFREKYGENIEIKKCIESLFINCKKLNSFGT